MRWQVIVFFLVRVQIDVKDFLELLYANILYVFITMENLGAEGNKVGKLAEMNETTASAYISIL